MASCQGEGGLIYMLMIACTFSYWGGKAVDGRQPNRSALS